MNNHNNSSPISLLGLAIWSLGALFFLYEFFLRTFVGSISHQLIPELHLTAEKFAMIGSAYYITYGLMQLPVGILSDKYGVKRVLIFATLVCVGATFLFSHATGFTSAFISRLLMGFGSSFGFVCLLVIAVTWFPKKYFGFIAGMSQFIGTIGPMIAGGPFIAIMAANNGNWHTALDEVNLVGGVLAVLMFIVIRNKPRDENQLIYLHSGDRLSQRLARLLRNPQAWMIAIYSSGVYITISLMGAIWGTEYLQACHLTQSQAASVISLLWLGNAIGCPTLATISEVIKRRKPALIFCALLGLFATTTVFYSGWQFAYWHYCVLFFCIGIAAAGQNVGFTTIIEHVESRSKAAALSLNNGVITFCTAFIPPLMGHFIHLDHHHHVTPKTFMFGFSIMPALYLTALLVAWYGIKETYCKPQKEILKLVPGWKHQTATA